MNIIFFNDEHCYFFSYLHKADMGIEDQTFLNKCIYCQYHLDKEMQDI